MQPQIPIIERAYQLARSGTCATVSEIKAMLKAEGYAYIEHELAGPALHASLRAACVASRAGDAAERRAQRASERNRKSKLARGP